MKIKILFIIFICIFLFDLFSVWSERQTHNLFKNSTGPAAYLPLTHIAFEPVIEGESVTLELVVQNRGVKPLKIQNVKPGWNIC